VGGLCVWGRTQFQGNYEGGVKMTHVGFRGQGREGTVEKRGERWGYSSISHGI